MKISYNWLKDFVKIKLTPEKLAEELTVKSFEVENVEKLGQGLEDIVVGEILDIKPHPQAEKLQLATVNIGKKEPVTFVCGAFNIKKGQEVPVVLVGTTLPDGTYVKKATIRGVESPGMLCSEKELGLGEDHTGIMILDPKLKVGQSLARALEIEDTVFDIDVLPNRAHDCLSNIGIAREVAAIINVEFEIKNLELREDKSLKIEDFVKVKVGDTKLCPRYTARVVSDIKVKDSPQWLKSRLQACGVRPINNIVDITNYVMLEYGQPMHAFDADKLTNKEIIVRRAKNGEKIITLDGEKRELTKDMLVITDSKKPIAIAGVMGGAEKEVKDTTKNIILESANFNSLSIRQTAAKLGLRSESSDRFGYGLDPNLASQAQDRAAYLMQELAQGKVVSGMIDIYPKKVKPWKVKVNLGWLDKFLGVSVSKNKVLQILKSLQFGVKQKGRELEVNIPTFRLDLTIPEDVAEEMARLYGYSKIEEQSPRGKLEPVPKNDQLYWENFIKDALSGAGFTEVYNYSFSGEKDLKILGKGAKDVLELVNPLNIELKYMRPSLVPGILQNVLSNLRNFDQFKIFELARVYIPKREGELPKEERRISGAMVSQQLFYEAKGVVELLLNKLGISEKAVSFKLKAEGWIWHPGRTAEIRIDKEIIGVLGEIHPKILARLDIESKVAMFDLDFDKIITLVTTKKAFKKIPKYPAITLDLAFILAKKTLHDHLKNAILEAGKPLVTQVELFDVYEGKPLEKGKKSLAFHITYQAEDRTLKDKEVFKIQDKIIKALEKKFGAKVRKE